VPLRPVLGLQVSVGPRGQVIETNRDLLIQMVILIEANWRCHQTLHNDLSARASLDTWMSATEPWTDYGAYGKALATTTNNRNLRDRNSRPGTVLAVRRKEQVSHLNTAKDMTVIESRDRTQR